MNPGVVALERLCELGVFAKGRPNDSAALQYWACGRPTPKKWVMAAGLVHVASSWVGTRGLSVMCGRTADSIVYCYAEGEDK